MNDTDMMAQPHAQSTPTSHLSNTLPRSFQFHHTDAADVPQTPERELVAPQAIAPPKQTFKVRRRRVDTSQEAAAAFGLSGAPLPTIEMTEAEEDFNNSFGPELAPGLLAPRPSFLRLVSPPRTPASQLTTYSTDSSQSNEWSMIHDVCGNLIERPLSACSTFSDSSANSFGSSNAEYSLGGSCTSPESDAADPFCYEMKSGPASAMNLPSSTDLPTAKRAKTSRHPKWTPDMDNHLWITYMIYVQDPRVTPFKMLPGTCPPLGVCHRVAREAKRTWKGHRAVERPIPRISIQRAGSPEFILDDRNTPTSFDSLDSRSSIYSRWPRSEAATRRRLRDLCKRKPSLSAHYVRLLRTRSPSPFESSSPKSHSNSAPSTSAHTPADVSTFSSRDMNVSLVAATAPSMQADGPLAQLALQPPAMTPATTAHGSTPAPATQRSTDQRPADWFARIGRSQARAQAHQKSQSLQLGLGLGTWSGPSTSFERGSILVSPFDSEPGRDQFLPREASTQSLGRGEFNRKAANGHSLMSPPEVQGAMPTARSLKRRYNVHEETPTAPQPSLQNMFAAPPTPASRPTMRHRGFSLGDMNGPARNISSFFTQPLDQTMEEAPEATPSTNYLAAPQLAQPPRLGSPFSGSSGARFNTFPRRRYTRPEADTQGVSFDEKLRQLAATSQSKN